MQRRQYSTVVKIAIGVEVFKLVWVKAHKRLRFGKSLFGFLHDTTYLSQQFLLVLNYGAFPDKGVLFVTDSILVPSMSCTYRDMRPSS